MKAISKIFFGAGALLAAAGFSACTGDLDLLPTDPRSLTAADFEKDPQNYMEQVMADVYLNYSSVGSNMNSVIGGFDGGMCSFSRVAIQLECFASDEMAWTIAGAEWGNFRYGQMAANMPALLGTYSRLVVNVSLCNDFIQTVNNGYFKLTEELQPQADEFIRQAQILRAGAFFYLMDCFGNVPYGHEEIAIGSTAPQCDAKTVYEGETALLEEIVAYYKANPSSPGVRPTYGYVGLDVAEALLVKYYLNAVSYGAPAAYDKVIDHSEAIISRLAKGGFRNSGLCYKYWQVFGHNNDQYAVCSQNNSGINEIIWDQVSDETYLQCWTGGAFLVNAWAGFDGGEASKWNASNGWKCLAARSTFVTTYFDWDANYTVSPDERTALWCTTKDGFPVENENITGNAEPHGFMTVKYSNFDFENDATGAKCATQPDAVDNLGIDYAAIRLAEIYLSAAEAYIQLGSNNDKATEYVNLIRERAGLDPYSAVSMPELIRERSAELYNEGCRRTDLIRWNMWLSGYNWSWKNGVPQGADYGPEMRWFPIPSQMINQGGYKQNPGY